MQSQDHYTGQDLFNSFQKGEEKAYAHYFHLHYKTLYYFANRIVRNEPLAEDIVADSFVKLFEKRVSIQSEATIKGFLYTTVRNACLDKLEQQKIRAGHHKELSYLQQREASPYIEELIRSETFALILEAIEGLPKAVRKVFQMHYFEGLSYEEISKITGTSKETIRKQKQLGLIALKGKLLLFLLIVLISLI